MGSFALLTLNVFGVPTPTTAWRLRTLAAQLDGSSYDAVCLQEVQFHPYRELLAAGTPSFPTAIYAPHLHAPRGGLLTLTRPRVVRNQFVPFNDRSIVTPLALMDWLLRKGVLVTELRCDGLPVVVLNTHLNANYSGDWSRGNRYAEVERRQLAQLAALAAAQPAEALVIVAGDFNIPRGGWLHEAVLAEGGLRDPLAADLRPTYRIFHGLPEHYAQAVDFALLRAPAGLEVEVTSELRFEERVRGADGAARYLSDHMAVELRVAWPERPGA